MKKYGQFLSNIFNPKHPDSRMRHLTSSFEAHQSGPKAMQQKWEQYLAWINSNVIGPPKATEEYTQKQLEDMNLVGVYSTEVENEN